MHRCLGLLSKSSSAFIASEVVQQQPLLDLASHGERSPVRHDARLQSIFIYSAAISSPGDLQPIVPLLLSINSPLSELSALGGCRGLACTRKLPRCTRFSSEYKAVPRCTRSCEPIKMMGKNEGGQHLERTRYWQFFDTKAFHID